MKYQNKRYSKLSPKFHISREQLHMNKDKMDFYKFSPSTRDSQLLFVSTEKPS